jgi:predicted dehydrogenase
MSPNEKVSLAFMGTGTRGLQLALEASRDPAVHISYLCDVDDRALESGAARISKRVKQAFTCISDFRMALDDPYVDALVVAAPDHWHFAAASMACAAGKHVYLEKPGCHNCEEAILLPKVAKRYSRLVQLGTQRRSDPRFADAIGKLRQGAIGSVRNARAWFNVKRPSIGYGNLTKAPDRFNYDLWQGPAPRKQYRDNLVPHNWHRFWHWGSGELGNNGVHLIDVCRWGLNVNFPKSVTSAGGKYLSVDDQETPDTHFAHFDFAGKSVAWEYRNDRPNL